MRSEPGAPAIGAGGAAPDEMAQRLLRMVASRPATLGPGRLLCLDGPAGSGKTTVAAAIADQASDAVVVHTDDLLEGWRGLPRLAETVRALLAPLAEDRASTWHRWDWHASRWAEEHAVFPGGLLVLEGVGSWSPGIAGWVGALGWIEAPYDERKRRGLERDGDDFAPYWEQWAADEAAVFARDRTREHADVVGAT